MAARYYLGIDQGTSGTTALLLNENFELAAQGYCDLGLVYPRPGWVEHAPGEVLDSVMKATGKEQIVRAALESIAYQVKDNFDVMAKDVHLSIGTLRGTEELAGRWRAARRFEPKMSADERQQLLHHWHRAVQRAKNWVEEA